MPSHLPHLLSQLLSAAGQKPSCSLLTLVKSLCDWGLVGSKGAVTSSSPVYSPIIDTLPSRSAALTKSHHSAFSDPALIWLQTARYRQGKCPAPLPKLSSPWPKYAPCRSWRKIYGISSVFRRHPVSHQNAFSFSWTLTRRPVSVVSFGTLLFFGHATT